MHERIVTMQGHAWIPKSHDLVRYLLEGESLPWEISGEG